MKLIEEEDEQINVYNLLIKYKLGKQEIYDLIKYYNEYVDTIHPDICVTCATQLRFMMQRLYHRWKISTNNTIKKYE